MKRHIVTVALILLFSAGVDHAQPNPLPERPEVRRLCQKWDGTLMIMLPNRPGYLRCEHIRVQFERTAKNGTLFEPIRRMIESVRYQSLLSLKVGDLPKDQKCTIERGSSTTLTCTTLDFEPEVSTQVMGTKSGIPMTAVVSSDLDWFKRQMTESIQKQYGVPPTSAFLEYYVELLVTVSSSLGGPNEQYSVESNRLVMRLNLQ